jgi:hypothetical protein
VLIPLFSHFTYAVNIGYDFGMLTFLILKLYNLIHNLVFIWGTGFGISCSYWCNSFRVIDIFFFSTIWFSSHILNVIPGIPTDACFFKRKLIIMKYNIWVWLGSKYDKKKNALLPKVIWPCGQLPSFLSFPRISLHVLPVYLSSFNLS